MGQYHSFQTQIAEQYGVNAAVLLEHIGFWIEKNEANGANYYDGNYWTFNSVKALCAMFPYMTARAIRTALEKLTDEGLIVKGNYNKVTYDRTLWYALTEKGKSILQYRQIHLSKTQNGFCENDKPIPDINTDNNITTIKEKETGGRFKKPTVAEVDAYCKERGNGIDAERFVDYYEARGWKIGKNEMKDWRAAVRTWEKNNRRESKNGQQNNEPPTNNANWHGDDFWGVKSVELD